MGGTGARLIAGSAPLAALALTFALLLSGCGMTGDSADGAPPRATDRIGCSRRSLRTSRSISR